MTGLVTRWWWVRHAVVTANQGVIYGRTDWPCDVSDLASFNGLATILPKQATLITSQLQRTKQTAESIKMAGMGAENPLQPSVSIEAPPLNEQNFGDWEGQSFAQMQAAAGRFATHDYWLCPGHLRPPNGESFLDLIARAAPFIEETSNNHPGKDIIAVAHGGTIRAALAIALGMDPERALSFTIDNLSVTRIDRIEKEDRLLWRVVMVNRPPTL
ncbi:MAG: histidine phosphatase family protein [Alphaproteobacteria bacterium]